MLIRAMEEQLWLNGHYYDIDTEPSINFQCLHISNYMHRWRILSETPKRQASVLYTYLPKLIHLGTHL